MVDTYQTKTTKIAKVEVVKLKSLSDLFYTVVLDLLEIMVLFSRASKNVIADYKNLACFIFSKGMKQFIDLINDQPENSVQSLDVFAHGSDLGLYSVIGASLKKSMTFEYSQSNNLSSNLYRNRSTKFDQYQFLVGLIGEIHSLFSDINFKVFTNESKIEIHGCNTAFDGELDTLSSLISLALFKAGKKKRCYWTCRLF